MRQGLLVEGVELIVVAHAGFIHPFPVRNVRESQPRLQVLVILLGLPELDFRVQRSLAPQTSGPLGLRNDIRFHKVLLSQGKLLYLLPLPFIEYLVHFVVRLVPEGLEVQEFGPVLDVPKLFQRSPMLVVIVLEDKGLLRLDLLSGGGGTSLRKLSNFSFCRSTACSLKSA